MGELTIGQPFASGQTDEAVPSNSKWRRRQDKVARGRGCHHRYRRNTGDDSPGGNRKAIGLGHQPTEAYYRDRCGGGEQAACYGDRCGGGEQAACPDEVYGLIVGRGEAARTAAVVHSRQTVTPENETAWILTRPPVYISGRPAIVKVLVGY